MKNGILLFILFLFTSLSAMTQNKDHIGVWLIVEDGEEVTLELDAKGYATFGSKGEYFGGEPVEDEDGYLVWTTYKVDYTTTPHTIVLINHSEGYGEVEVFEAPGLFEIYDKGQKMKILLNFEDEIYPTEFNEEETLIATKVE